MSRKPDPTEVAATVVAQACALLDAPSAVLRWWDQDRGMLVKVADSIPERAGIDIEVPAGAGGGGTAFATRAPVIVRDYRKWGNALRRGEDVRSIVAVPLLLGDRAVGALSVHAMASTRVFTEEESQILSLFAAEVAPVLEVGRLLQRSERERTEAELLADVTRLLSAATRLRDVGEAILRSTCLALGWSAGAIWMKRDGDQELVCNNNWFEANLRDGPTLRLSDGEVPGQVWRTGQEIWSAASSGPGAGSAFRTVAASPIRSAQRMLGVLELGIHEHVERDERVARVLVAVAGQVGQFVDRRQSERRLESSERLLLAVLESALDAHLMLDAEGRVTGWNPQGEAIFGWKREEIVGRSFVETLLPQRSDGQSWEWLSAADGATLQRRVELTALRRNGMEFPIELALVPLDIHGATGYSAFIRDISDRRQMDSQLRLLALHDSLTGLPNRRLLLQHLEELVSSSSRAPSALLLVDLDRFKDVNDTFGHSMGDRLLQGVGARIRGASRRVDTVARLGGDEFAVLLPSAGLDAATGVAKKLLHEIGQPHLIDAHSLYVGASIGIAIFPDHASDAGTLLRRADVAMYVAKRLRSGVAVYEPMHDAHAAEKLAIAHDLRRDIAAGRMMLWYQPIVDVPRQRVVCVEALARWRHNGALVPPAVFIPLAEQAGVLGTLTDWVVQHALDQLSAWRDAGESFEVAVNVSMGDVTRAGFLELVGASLRDRDLPAGSLCVEITESDIMADPAKAVTALEQLRAMGVRLSVDDFGTGYSSLAYLHALPVHALKIDRSFVSQLTSQRKSLAIVRAAVELARGLDLDVVAEGVEDHETLSLVTEAGCALVQGYLFAPPMPPAEVDGWLRQFRG